MTIHIKGDCIKISNVQVVTDSGKMDLTSDKEPIPKDTTRLLVDGILLSRRTCPQCGSLMKEIERVIESGSIFIWYECENAKCDGQWLQKYQRQMDVAV